MGPENHKLIVYYTVEYLNKIIVSPSVQVYHVMFSMSEFITTIMRLGVKINFGSAPI